MFTEDCDRTSIHREIPRENPWEVIVALAIIGTSKIGLFMFL